MKLLRVSEMVAAEKAADAAGVSYAQLMETAGKRLAEALQQHTPIQNKNILILVGPGNNGGDGLVAGRLLAEQGANVAFYLSHPRDPGSDSNYAEVQQMRLFIAEADHDQRFRVLRTRLNITDILIDGLLGTGVSRPIEGKLAALLKQVAEGLKQRQQGREDTPNLVKIGDDFQRRGAEAQRDDSVFVVAVDCPSGLNCDNGSLDPLTIPAELTVTFGAPKWGHFLFPGAAACGELVVADIGITADLPEMRQVQVEVATAVSMRPLLPKRPLSGHKGTFGKVIIAAGSAQYRGAPLLSARGAFRAGAGLVSLFVPSSIRDVATVQLPEATYPRVAEVDQLSAESALALIDQLDQYQALLVGPGLGDAASFMETLCANIPEHSPPIVIDADGLNIISQWPDWPQRIPPNSVLTPHPKEMSRLMGISMSEMNGQNRIAVTRKMAAEWGHVVLLKGAFTVVAAPDGLTTVLPFANPVLAVGGSGDVLSGVIVALLGQGGDVFETAVLGGYLHGLVSSLTPLQSGLLAAEISDLIPQAMQQLRI